MNEEKPHWQRLKELIESSRNGKATLHWQDGLPISLDDIETKRRQVDLTKDAD